MPEMDPLIDPAIQREILVSRIGGNPTQAAAGIGAFFDEVYRYCIRLMTATASVPPGPLAFALSERGLEVDPVFDQHSKEFVPNARLDIDPVTSVPVGPVLLTTRNLRLAYATTCRETDALGVATRLRDLGLGSRPTAIFVPSQRMLTFYSGGVDQKPSLSANTDALAALNLEDLDSVLTFFHENYTRYPTGLGTCWDNATHRIVERNAERNIRNHLFIFLSWVVYRSKYIVREYDRPNGRVDIFIFGIAMGEQDQERVLELKVLRSRSSGWTVSGGKARSYSDASNVRYVEKGLRQAKRYLESTMAIEGFLLCFDARLNDEEISVTDYAHQLGICYRRYYMQSSVKEEATAMTASSSLQH
jgi:hypothetical protein